MSQRIRLLTIGKVKTSWIAEGCQEFTKRLSRGYNIEQVALKPGTVKEEGERILAALKKRHDLIVLLHDRGRPMTSPEFGAWLKHLRDQSQDITFLIGGAYGVDERVKEKAQQVLSLSHMTFPHELCQLIFLEQLYRGFSIAAGSQYHH